MKAWLRAYVANGALSINEPDYASMSFVELKQLAKERGIKFKAAIRKDELIALLEANDDSQA